MEDEIDRLTSQFNDFNKHDPVLCGKLHSAKLRINGVNIPDNQLIGNRVYNDMQTFNHSKSKTSKTKTTKSGKGIKPEAKAKSKPKCKDKYKDKNYYFTCG